MTEQKQPLAARIASWPRRAKEFYEELKTEMRRVTWPTPKQVRATTAVVLACVFAFAAYFWVIDLILTHTLTRAYLTLTK